MAKTEYEVLRRHVGDKDYYPGDTRTADSVDVGHLIGTVLKEKAAPKPKGKKS